MDGWIDGWIVDTYAVLGLGAEMVGWSLKSFIKVFE